MEQETKENPLNAEELSAGQEKKIGRLDRFFGITRSGSSYKAEFMAGITTFMAMVYALLAIPGMYDFDGIDATFGAVYIATSIGAIVGTMLMAFVAKMPLAQASGLGATAYVTGTLLGRIAGLTYANAMIFVLIDGIIFLLLTVTGLRQKILTAIPDEVKKAVPVGIGLFIGFYRVQERGRRNARRRVYNLCFLQRPFGCAELSGRNHRSHRPARRYRHRYPLEEEREGRDFMGHARRDRAVLCADGFGVRLEERGLYRAVYRARIQKSVYGVRRLGQVFRRTGVCKGI